MASLKRPHRYTKKKVEELLLAHSDALVSGQGEAASLTGQPAVHDARLGGLFRLSKRLYETLLPVEPSRQFVVDLKARLAEAQAESAAAWGARKERTARISSVLGLFLSALAVMAISVRLFGSVVMLVVLLFVRKRPAAPERKAT